MKTLLSIFDYSGQWSAPFVNGGWYVIQWDIKLQDFMDINLIDSAETALEMFDDVDGILAAPPCTDFTVSGAQYWPKKDANGTTAKAIALVNQVQKLADLYRPTDDEFDGPFFWCVENPVGRMGKLTGLDDPKYFHPYEYAGYLEPSQHVIKQLLSIQEKKGIGVTQQETDLVLKWNAYTKKTGLWGEFVMPEKKPLFNVKTAPQGSFTQRLGGKSDKTKELRSNTPRGFAEAFYEANKNYSCTLKQLVK